MSQNESVLYPADPNEAMPSEEELVRRLLQSGFMIQRERSQWGFELSKAFMTTSELDAYETNAAAGVSFPGQRVHIEIHETPQIFTSVHIQYIDKITSPAGNSWGDLETAYSYLQALSEDPAACVADPVSGIEYPIHSLEFNVDDVSAVGFGCAKISIRGYRTPDESRLDELALIAGMDLKHCYLAG